jgi:hypothetical protein
MLRLEYSYEYSDQHQPLVGRRRARVGEIRGHHDEVSTLSETKRLSLDAGLSNRLSLQVILPFVHREHQHIHHHMGADLAESWNFNGAGDLSVLARYAIRKGSDARARFSLIAGGVLPTGRDQAVNADGDAAEVGILPGKNAYSLILGAAISRSFTGKTANGLYGAWPVFFSSTYQWNRRGEENYRMGNTWQGNVGAVYPVFPAVGLITQINARISRKDDRGDTREEVQKTGSSVVCFSPGLQLTLAKNLWSSIIVQLPVYQRVNQIQLVSEYNVLSSVSYRFSVL